MQRLFYCLFALSTGIATGAGTQTTISVNVNGSLIGLTYFGAVGTANLTGFGTATITASGSVASVIGGSSAPVTGTFGMQFPNGDFLVGTLSLPAGYVLPQGGATANGTGMLTITGGTGQFQGATGSFPSVVGSGTVTGPTSASVQFSGSGSITLANGSGGGGTGPRTIAHTGDGNLFKTTIILTNTDSAAAPYSPRLNDPAGNVVTQRFELELGSLTGSIPGGGSVVIRTAGLGNQTLQGWAELTAPPTVGATVIYSQPGNGGVQEGTTSVAASGSSHFFFPFDDTGGAATAAALTNSSGTAANNVMVTLHYANGTQETVPLGSPIGARSHTSLALSSQFPHTANASGVAEVVSDQPLYGVVFRFNSTGAFTALDLVAR